MRARVLSSLLCGFLLALLSAGCTNRTVKKVQEMADRACACSDVTCAEKVEKEFFQLAKTNQKGTREDRDEVQAHYNRMRECIVKLRSAGTGATAGTDGKPEAAPVPDTSAKTGVTQ